MAAFLNDTSSKDDALGNPMEDNLEDQLLDSALDIKGVLAHLPGNLDNSYSFNNKQLDHSALAGRLLYEVDTFTYADVVDDSHDQFDDEYLVPDDDDF